MRRTYGFLALAGCLVAAMASGGGCSGGGDTGTGAGGTGGTTSSSGTMSSSSGGPGIPMPPALGAQIDRFGRPAVNTATNHTFDTDMAAKDAAKDKWNADSDPSKWATTYGADVGKTLGILDALDAMCGNQAFADKTKTDPSRYAALAGMLADDRLWINTAAATCGVYLAVEANATNFLPNNDCGGRKLDYDVIDESYSLMAAGATSGVSDGVPADGDTAGKSFPYLAAPH